MSATDLCFTSAVELAELIRRRALSPVEITRAVLERIERLNGRLGAYVLLHAERALERAREAEQSVMAGQPLGPLHGVPVSIKDNLWTAGDRTTFGSRLLAEFVPPEDAPSVAGLRAAGAILVGRTNLPEFAWRGSTDNPLFGASRNPWDPTRTPGGSTGGGAAAVAAGLGPLALGSDGAGSIRIPASFCGLVGLKPTFGRVPMYPAAGGNELVAYICPLARTVRDVALMMNATARYDRRDPFALPDDGVDYLAACDEPLVGAAPVRIAWSASLGFAPVEPETREICAAAARAFAEVGLEVEEASPDLGDPSWILQTLYGGAQAGAHAARPAEQKAQMDPALVAYAEASASLTVVEYLRAVAARQALVDALRRFFERYDLLLTPTLGLPAFPLGLVGPREVAGREVTHLGWTLCYPFNYSGQPAISIPAGWTASGLPVGLQIVGRRLEDVLVLRAAAAFEALRPWAARRPSEAGRIV
ncbi:MAG TPA: amidase family protein [Chloroflexota bacterium]|jgi:aspartyl-tRNA(Asn)/glutamyl-tRNA(Gln) amidotransferase subunit A|nr:amidase family protein [Chloroflexota bacterium]